jgi:hypothetical protein
VVEVTLPDPDGPGPLAAPVYSYTYDLVGNLLSVTDPLNNTTSTRTTTSTAWQPSPTRSAA